VIKRQLKNTRKLLSSAGTVVAVALLARLIYLVLFFDWQPAHVAHYQIGEEIGSIAVSIASGHGFSSPLYAPSGPTAWSTPVYPYLLAGVFRLFGTYTRDASIAIRFLNVLFSALTTYPVILIGRKLFGSAVGAAAGWIWAFLPMAIVLPVSWAWEMSLAALLLTTVLWMTYQLDDRDDARLWGLYGFVWGFTTLVSGAALCVLPGCLLYLAFCCRRRSKHWKRLVSYAAVAFAVTIAPWILRNQWTFQGRVLLRSNFGLELWLGNNPQVPDTWTWWLHPLDSVKERDEFFKLGEVEYMEEKKAAALQFIRTHPADVARFQFHRFLETWTGHSDSFADIWATRSPQLRADLLMNYSLCLLTFFGMLLAHRRMALLSLPLLNALVFFPMVYYVCHTTARYRHPIDPLLAILSAYAIVSCVRAVAKWTESAVRKRQIATANAAQ
jgi:4-amino-4-deoxy-L-arabinose transferase-like glycosyltransferase